MTPRVLLEDDWLLALDKPAGLAVHGGAGLRESLDDWLAKHLGARVERNGFRASAAHRLDRETSGVLLVAKRRPAMRALMQAFEAREVEKTYLALVQGSPGKQGRIDRPIADERGRPQPSVTTWRAVETFPEATLVECSPETGRKHQIRLHFRAIGHPLAGDPAHGEPAFNARARDWQLERLFLHAARLVFPHPRDGARTTLEAPLPPELARVVDRLRG